jgi:hypothetical protein
VVNAAQVVAALRTHYGDGWALVEQVAAGTGYAANRHLDVVAVGLWPSRGLHIDGIEVKVSRADLKRELADPAKADEVAAFCDRFWIAAPTGVVHADMLASLAPAWGILEVSEQSSRTIVKVVRQAAQTESKPVSRAFLAAVLRRLPNPTAEAREQIRAEEREAVKAEAESRIEYEVGKRMRTVERTVERVRAFEEASGINLDEADERWRWLKASDIGAAVEFIARDRGLQWSGYARRLTSAAQTARSVAHQLETMAESLDGAAVDVGGADG